MLACKWLQHAVMIISVGTRAEAVVDEQNEQNTGKSRSGQSNDSDPAHAFDNALPSKTMLCKGMQHQSTVSTTDKPSPVDATPHAPNLILQFRPRPLPLLSGAIQLL